MERIESKGLVKVLSKRGVFICTISPDDMREIYDVIIACESIAAELLAGLPGTHTAMSVSIAPR
jgi:DNA-binding GntR family transcriptional regulator